MSQLESRLREITTRVGKDKKRRSACGSLLLYKEIAAVLELYDAALENCGPKMRYGSDRLHRALKRVAGREESG